MDLPNAPDSVPATDRAPASATDRLPHRKPFSNRRLLLTGGGVLALILGAGFAAYAYLWIQRVALGEATILKVLNDRGVEADIKIEKLQWDGAEMTAGRVGPADDSTLTFKSAHLRWRMDWSRRILIITDAKIDGARLKLSLDQTGKLNFGSLSSFLEPSDGPKQFRIDNLSVTNSHLILAAPALLGSSPLEANVTISGNEGEGWKGLALLSIPAAWQVPSTSQSGQVPIKLGFAAPPTQRAGYTPLGATLDFEGQSMASTPMGVGVRGLSGRYTVGLVVGPEGFLQIDGKAARLKAGSFKAPGFALSEAVAELGPFAWQHKGAWNKAASVSASAKLTAGATQGRFANTAVAAAASQLVLGVSRKSDGTFKADYALGLNQLRGTVTAQSIGLAGKATGFVGDLAALSQARINGQAQITSERADVSAWALAQVPTQQMPIAVKTSLIRALEGVNGQTSLLYDVAGDRFSVQMTSPVQASSNNGARIAWAFGEQPTTIAGVRQADGTWQVSTLASGALSLFAPGLGQIAASLDGFVQGPNGWALTGRRGRFDQINWGGLILSGQIDAFELSALRGAALPNGVVRGSLEINGKTEGQTNGLSVTRGAMTFDVTSNAGRSAVPRIDASLAGRFGEIKTAEAHLSAGTFNFRYQGQAGVSGVSNGQWRADGFVRALKAQGTTASNFRISGLGQARTDAQNGINLTWTGQAEASEASSTAIILQSARVRSSGSANVFEAAAAGSRIQGPVWSMAGKFDVAAPQGRLENGSFKALTASWVGSGRGTGGGASNLVAGQTTARLGEMQIGARGDGLAVQNALISGPLEARFGPTADRWAGQLGMSLRADRVSTGQTELQSVALTGPVEIAPSTMGGIGVTGLGCMPLSARSIVSGEVFVDRLAGTLCPDRTGRFARVADEGVSLYADAKLQPSLIRLGSAETGQTLQLDAVSADFKPGPDGSWTLGVTAPRLTFGFKLPDGAQAYIKAQQSVLNIVPRDGATQINATLSEISSEGLPVTIAGQGTGVFDADAKGLNGRFAFDGLNVVDVPGKVQVVPRDEAGNPTGPAQEVDALPRFGSLVVDGNGTYLDGILSIVAKVQEARTRAVLADVTLKHDVATDEGRVDLATQAITFAPRAADGSAGLQPADVVPALGGVVLDAVGTLTGSAYLSWSADTPVQSGGSFGTEGISFDTLLGPVDGVRGRLTLADLLTVRSDGPQIFDIKAFNPGLPILGGTIAFTLPGDNTLQLDDARWPFADGTLSVRPATWAFKDGDQAFAIDVNDVDLAQFLRLTEVPNLEIDGRVSGVFPIEVKNGIVEIVNGSLKARDGGGMIRYTGPSTAPPPPPPTWLDKLRGRVAPAPPPQGAELAIAALRALEYKIMEITVNGRITGDLMVGVLLEGANQQVLSGIPFRFNIKANVPIGQLGGLYNSTFGTDRLTEQALELYRLQQEEDSKKAEDITPPEPPPSPPVPVPVP